MPPVFQIWSSVKARDLEREPDARGDRVRRAPPVPSLDLLSVFLAQQLRSVGSVVHPLFQRGLGAVLKLIVVGHEEPESRRGMRLRTRATVGRPCGWIDATGGATVVRRYRPACCERASVRILQRVTTG